MKLVRSCLSVFIASGLVACGGGGGDEAAFSDRFAPGGVTPEPTPQSSTPPPAEFPVEPPQGDEGPGVDLPSSPIPPQEPDPAPTAEPTPVATVTPNPTPIATPVPTAAPTPPPDDEPPDLPPTSGGGVFTSGPHNVGNGTLYFDLDTGALLALTAEQAEANDDWDIAFSDVSVRLNAQASQPVVARFTGNNTDFFDEAGAPIAEEFFAATAETELADLLDYLPPESLAPGDFASDTTQLIIGDKFLTYNPSEQLASPATERYFVVQSDGDFSKIRAKAVVNSGELMSSLTLGVAHQATLLDQTDFAEEQDLELNFANCDGDVYIDLASLAQVESEAPWDIRLPCVTSQDDGPAGAAFEINLANNATAFETDASLLGIDIENLEVYPFEPNSRIEPFFELFPWFQTNLDDASRVWSQFGVYHIVTAQGDYKLQILSFYDENDTPQRLTFRFQQM